MSSCQVAVAGGGLAGSTLALALAGLGLKIALVEPRSGPEPEARRRTLAFSLGTCRILQALGVWPELVEEAMPIRQIHVSEVGQPGMTRLRAEENKLSAFGYTVASDRLAAVLAAQVAQQPQIELFGGTRVTGVSVEPPAVRLALSGAGPDELVAELAVAADGSESALRTLAGIPLQRRDYGRSAVVAAVVAPGAQPGIAYERFDQQGPIALLPIAGVVGESHFGLVWTVTPERAEQLQALSDSAFSEALGEKFGGRIAGLQVVAGARGAFPLEELKAQRLSAPGIALVANAAQTLHPVAGQGDTG